MPVALAASPQIPAHLYRSLYYEHCRCDGPYFDAPVVVSYLQNEVQNVFAECQHDGWDGYGATPISLDAFNAAQRFVASLPAGVRAPVVSADPDGRFTFQWRSGQYKVLLVSVAANFEIDFAARFGDSRVYGTETFFDRFPTQLETLLTRVLA